MPLGPFSQICSLITDQIQEKKISMESETKCMWQEYMPIHIRSVKYIPVTCSRMKQQLIIDHVNVYIYIAARKISLAHTQH